VPKTSRELKKSLVLPTKAGEKIEDEEVFELMDREDEKQIRADLMGRFADEYVYSFPVETKEGKTQIYGLSYAGTKELCKEVNIRGKARYTATDIPPIVEEHDTYWLAKIQAEDKVTGLKIWGVKRQSKYKSIGKIDEHAEAIAVSKAQRNALQGLLPRGLVQDFIKEYIEKKKHVKEIEKPKVQIGKAKKKPEKADIRDSLTKEIIRLSKKLTESSGESIGDFLRKAFKEYFGKEAFSDLSLDELKWLCVELENQQDRNKKGKKEVSDVQAEIRRFFGETD